MTLVAGYEVFAGAVIDTGRGIAFVVFKFTEFPTVARQTVALEFSHAVLAHSVHAGLGLALIDVHLAVRALETCAGRNSISRKLILTRQPKDHRND